jgi:hypothetical protein
VGGSTESRWFYAKVPARACKMCWGIWGHPPPVKLESCCMTKKCQSNIKKIYISNIYRLMYQIYTDWYIKYLHIDISYIYILIYMFTYWYIICLHIDISYVYRLIYYISTDWYINIYIIIDISNIYRLITHVRVITKGGII